MLFRSELECEAFIPTSQSYGLERRERLFGAVRDDLDTAQRREMLLKRSAFGNADFTLEGIGRILDFLGIQGEIKEYPNVNRVVVEVQNEGLTKGQRNWIVSQLGALFPAHLEVDGVFEGFSWEQIDANGYDFAQMEATLRTWFEIDYYCM